MNKIGAMLTAIASAALFSAIGARVAAPAAIDASKIVDLTYTFGADTVYWPTEWPFKYQYESIGMTPGGYFYAHGKLEMPEHIGTHMDAPLHFSKTGMSTDQVPLKNCIGPAAVIDFSARAAKDPNATLSVDDINQYEKNYGEIPAGAIVVARSGWGRYWPDTKRYMGTGKRRDTADLRFPGWSAEAVKFLLANRNVAAIAIDTASIDPGSSKDFPVHQAWLGANRPAFENLANADKLPPSGATIFCLPMKIGKGTGGPTRVVALLP